MDFIIVIKSISDFKAKQRCCSQNLWARDGLFSVKMWYTSFVSHDMCKQKIFSYFICDPRDELRIMRFVMWKIKDHFQYYSLRCVWIMLLCSYILSIYLKNNERYCSDLTNKIMWKQFLLLPNLKSDMSTSSVICWHCESDTWVVKLVSMRHIYDFTTQ